MTVKFIRKAVKDDVSKIMEIIQKAKKILADENIPQWQSGYPDLKVIEDDINKGYAYVLIVGTSIAGVVTLLQEEEPNYCRIYAGKWAHKEKAEKYASIHRIAIDANYSGEHLSDFFFSNILTIAYQLGFRQIRIDTHASNKRMQHIVGKIGFSYSGVVYMHGNSKDKRNAYQLFLTD